MIENDINNGKDPRDTWSASGRRIFLKDDLPEPKFCDPEYCVVSEPPECLNYELPTFGKSGARIEAPDGDSNPYKGENQNWTVWHAPNDVWYMVDGDDVAYFQDRDDKEICRHLDACGGMTAQVWAEGMVVFPRVADSYWASLFGCESIGNYGKACSDKSCHNTLSKGSNATLP